MRDMSLTSTISPENSTLPIRHPSESWDPVPLALCKSLDDSLRSPLRGHPSDVLRAARYVQLSLG
jgi:hypothetical protein